MNWVSTVLAIASALALVLFAYRWAVRKRSKDEADANQGSTSSASSDLQPGSVAPLLGWINVQPPRVKQRRENLLGLRGLLEHWMQQARSCKQTFLNDRVTERCLKVLDDPSDDNRQPGELLCRTMARLEEARELLARLADVMVTQLATETVRRTSALVIGDLARRQFQLELSGHGQAMHEAKLLVEEIDKLLGEPIYDDQDRHSHPHHAGEDA